MTAKIGSTTAPRRHLICLPCSVRQRLLDTRLQFLWVLPRFRHRAPLGIRRGAFLLRLYRTLELSNGPRRAFLQGHEFLAAQRLVSRHRTDPRPTHRMQSETDQPHMHQRVHGLYEQLAHRLTIGLEETRQRAMVGVLPIA